MAVVRDVYYSMLTLITCNVVLHTLPGQARAVLLIYGCEKGLPYLPLEISGYNYAVIG